MDFEPLGGGRSFGVGTSLDEWSPFSSLEFNWTFAGKWGAFIAAIWAAQAAAGALAGGGMTWAGAHETHYGPPNLLGFYSRYMPNLTLGSSVFYAHAGDVVHVTSDANIRTGQIDVYLWRMPGMNNSPSTHITKSGVEEFDIPISEDGLYNFMNSASARWPSSTQPNHDGILTDLNYKLSWKRQRPAQG